jgi:glycosyltransferase involved in cell wall biosynthesis
MMSAKKRFILKLCLPILGTSLFFFIAPFFHLSRVEIVQYCLPHHDLPVSIIIPLYNREQYIERALQSAINQTLPEIEVLVVDDHSNDSSVEIVNHMIEKDHRIRLIQHSENTGTHLARVTAVKESRGTFILSLDSDDRLLPSIAAIVYRVAVLQRADIVEFQALEYFNETGVFELFSFLPPTVKIVNGGYLARKFAQKQLNWNIWKRLIRRSKYLEALELLKYREIDRKIVYGEDKLHIGLVLLVMRKFVYVEEIGYVYYRDNPENSESGSNDSMMMSMSQLRYVERVLKAIYRYYRNVEYFVDKGIPAGFRMKLIPIMSENLTAILWPRKKHQRRHR